MNSEMWSMSLLSKLLRIPRTAWGKACGLADLRRGERLFGGPTAGERDALESYEAALREPRPGRGRAPMDHVHIPLHPPTRTFDVEGRPLPPLALAKRIGAPTLEEFELVGRETKRTILRCLPRGLDLRGARVLDFGCGVARVLRYFTEEAKTAEFWGCDIDGPSIRWDVENLSPPFRFFQLSETPTIPMEDSSFDLVYAISVFAHIHIDWHHWMTEVRRILKPGGYFFVTFMAQTPFEEMLGQSYFDYGPNFGKYIKNPFSDWNAGGPMAFQSVEWIKTFWGNLFDIEFIALDGLLEYQSICLMRKPELGTPITTDIPVIRHSTAQSFNPDAVGRILARFDLDRGYRDSYGIEAHGVADVEGWIVFRDDAPVALDVLVDGSRIEADAEFAGGAAYQAWKGSRQTAFAVSVDLTGVSPGEHRLEIRLRSAGGKAHAMAIPLIVREGAH